MAALRSPAPLSTREQRELIFSPDAVALALRGRRVAEGLSMTALGARLRVDGQTVGHWERGGMPATAARMLSYVYAEATREELWRVRALTAETALRRMTEALAIYRGEVRAELAERANGS
jgi:transcriptional regulator with XRE-family HTH domain